MDVLSRKTSAGKIQKKYLPSMFLLALIRYKHLYGAHGFSALLNCKLPCVARVA